MKKFINTKTILFSLILVLFITNNIISQTIHFEFANEQITGTSPQYYEFDIMASSDSPAQFKVAQVYLSYNALGFGTYIKNNGKVLITYAGSQSDLLYPVIGTGGQIGNYEPSVIDNSASVIAIQNIWYKSGTGTETGVQLSNTLSSTPKVFVHVKIEILNQSQTSGISFVNGTISQGNLQNYLFTTGNNKSVYPGVTYGSGLNSPLPVELSSFTAVVNKKGILLNWSTETEVNNYGFEIEGAPNSLKKENAVNNFTKIGFVAGNGNSNSPKKYSYLIEGVKYGNYAYRLKQIDNDGKYEYSKTIEVNAGEIPNGFVLEQNYPNPFNPSTIIRFASSESSLARLVIYDVLGNEVAELLNEQLEANKVYNLEFNARNLASGVYYYRLITTNKNIVKKMLLLK